MMTKWSTFQLLKAGKKKNTQSGLIHQGYFKGAMALIPQLLGTGSSAVRHCPTCYVGNRTRRATDLEEENQTPQCLKLAPRHHKGDQMQSVPPPAPTLCSSIPALTAGEKEERPLWLSLRSFPAAPTCPISRHWNLLEWNAQIKSTFCPPV